MKNQPSACAEFLENRINALIYLLSDQDPQIAQTIHDQLVAVGHPALALLERAQDTPDEPTMSDRIGSVIADIKLTEVENSFKSLSFKPVANHRGQANITSVLFLLIIIVGSVWTWNHLDFDTQDFIIDEVVPVLFLLFAVTLGTWLSIRKIKRKKNTLKRRDLLIQRFSQEKSPKKRFDLASELIDLNNYKQEGLESIAKDMAEVLILTFKRSLGDKQHRIRGMAASYLGVIQHRESIPLLMKALEDDHAYVRGCAALALGRMRATEAKAKLEYTMKEDWDQTVRSRSREAVERMS